MNGSTTSFRATIEENLYPTHPFNFAHKKNKETFCRYCLKVIFSKSGYSIAFKTSQDIAKQDIKDSRKINQKVMHHMSMDIILFTSLAIWASKYSLLRTWNEYHKNSWKCMHILPAYLSIFVSWSLIPPLKLCDAIFYVFMENKAFF